MTKEELAGRLSEIIKQAESRNSHIFCKEEVDGFFAGEELSEEQLHLVYDYLLAKKIVVEGYLKEIRREDAEGEDRLSGEDRRYLEEYREMLSALEAERPGEKERLFRKAADGERQARDRLSELLLPEVLKLATGFAGGEVLLPDLVQEGNLCLLQGLEELTGRPALAPDAAERLILQGVRQGMLALAEQQKDVKSRDRRMVSRVQELKDSVAVLKEEMGRKVYLDEVADFMSISEEEAEAILKLAGEEVPEEE